MTDIEHDDIRTINIEDEMRQSYVDYAMSVIVGRALPDVRDGLKPVHRRVLFAMSEQNNAYNRPYMKSARIVGDVIGKYHPHGDTASYYTIVRMAQNCSCATRWLTDRAILGHLMVIWPRQCATQKCGWLKLLTN